jgi:copper(I)-binding protein
MTVRLARLVLTVLILIILIFVGCRRAAQTPTADNSDLHIALQPMPAEETLVVILTDAAGTPVTGATIALEGNMNHAGMIPVLAEPVADDADGSADGRYHLPFTFTMLGDWIVTVTVTQADGSSFRRDLDVQASEEGIKGDTVVPAESATPAPEGNIGSDAEGEAHDTGDHEGGDHEESTSTHAPELHIHDPMARPAPLAGGTAAVYFLLHNGGASPVTFTSAESPAASAVELHTTANDNGVMRMRQIPAGVELAAGESIQLTPGEMHLMLVDLAAPLAEGDTLAMTLHFAGAADLTFDVPVVAMDDLAGEDKTEGETEHDH